MEDGSKDHKEKGAVTHPAKKPRVFHPTGSVADYRAAQESA